MLEIGNYNELRVTTQTPIGVYLTDEEEEVLLPSRYVPGGIAPGDTLNVFVYLDNESRPVATSLKPYALVGEFAYLKVKEVNEHGAFLDWGIDKDLFMPYSEQREPMRKGDQHVVYIFIDDRSGRIAATSKWKTYLNQDISELQNGEEVQLMIAGKTDLGYKVIIENMFEGLLYENEVFEPLHTGDLKRGYIKNIREDGKIDVSLQQQGYAHISDLKSILLDRLKKNNGVIKLGDKSSAEEIYSELNMSKKSFKKTIGGLYKDRLITINDYEIKLAK